MKCANIPRIDRRLLAAFRWFNRRYLKKHFHSVAINARALAETPITEGDCLVVFANHASWWDPLTAVFCAEHLFPAFRMYAPIDAAALKKYAIFTRMGFFPVTADRLRGSAEFLKTSHAILSLPRSSIWVTPEGRFTDVRDSSTPLMPGIAHLAANCAADASSSESEPTHATSSPRVWFVASAVEYVFWEERKPELLIWIGRPICASPEPMQSRPTEPTNKSQWLELLTDRLRSAQAELSRAAIARDVAAFDIALSSTSGTFFLYDWWRRLRALSSGSGMRVDHSNKLSRD